MGHKRGYRQRAAGRPSTDVSVQQLERKNDDGLVFLGVEKHFDPFFQQ